MDTFELFAKVEKVEKSLGLIIGKAIVCSRDGEPYYDRQGDLIPEDAMLKAAFEFMRNSRVASINHSGEVIGNFLFAMPLTKEVDEALGIIKNWTGLVVGAHIEDKEVLKLIEDGKISGFSIGGIRIEDEEVEIEVPDA